MTRSNEGSDLMSAAFHAGSCFAIVTAPLALFGSNTLDLNAGGFSLYQGRLADVASPYLALAAAASVGVAGLKRRKGSESQGSESQGSEPQDSESKVQEHSLASATTMPPLQISEQDLSNSGLDFFLGDSSDDLATPQNSSNVEDAEGCEPLFAYHAPVQTASTPVREPIREDNSPVEHDFLLDRPDSDPVVLHPASVKMSQGERSERKLALEPEFLALEAQPQDLRLDRWTEAFLSDGPLVDLQDSLQQVSSNANPSVSQLLEALSGQGHSSQEVPSELATQANLVPLSHSSEMPHSSPAPADTPNHDIAVLATTQRSADVVHSLDPMQSAIVMSASNMTATPQHSHGLPTLPAAQAYVGFSHLAQATTRAYSPVRDVNAELEALEQLQSVREQIQSLSAQMEMIQTNLYPQTFNGKRLVALPSTPPKPTYVVETMERSSEQYQIQSPTTSPVRHRAIAS